MKNNEPLFGEKLGPVLKEIEDSILEHRDMYPGEPCGYSNDAFRAAISIFLDVAVEKMWEYQERLDMPMESRLEVADKFLDDFRLFIFKYCDIATEKLFKE